MCVKIDTPEFKAGRLRTLKKFGVLAAYKINYQTYLRHCLIIIGHYNKKHGKVKYTETKMKEI